MRYLDKRGVKRRRLSPGTQNIHRDDDYPGNQGEPGEWGMDWLAGQLFICLTMYALISR
jgi:hypothetical protein